MSGGQGQVPQVPDPEGAWSRLAVQKIMSRDVDKK